jgi:phage tail tape-measure protein
MREVEGREETATPRREKLMPEVTRVDDAEQPARIAGILLGVAAGARAGTVILPIPALGTLVGAVAGGILGEKAGQVTGRIILRGTAALAGAVSSATAKVAGATGEPPPRAS